VPNGMLNNLITHITNANILLQDLRYIKPIPAIIDGIEMTSKIVPINIPTDDKTKLAVASLTTVPRNENPLINAIPNKNKIESNVINNIDKIVKCLLLSIIFPLY
tara:strand:+ start:97 stop:411 length:315 start_codon:yes stop_codon:yes gene_type:complete